MRLLAALVLILVLLPASAEEQAEREQIRWDLTDLYASDDDWEHAFGQIQGRVRELEKFRENFGRSARTLADQLEEQSAVIKDFYRLSIYASMQNDEDQRDADSQQRRAKVRALGTEFGEVTSWQDPVLLALGEKKLERYIEKEPRLAPFDTYILELIREAPHSLDEKGEAMLAAASALTSSPSQIYGMIANADIPWPALELTGGKKYA